MRFVAVLVALVGGSMHDCNQQGTTIFSKEGICECISGFTGPDCSLRRCRSGRAWVDYPTFTDEAHAKDTECSGMGYCDRNSGECLCREGFDGSACERIACPKDDSGETCSGHGQCLTKRQAAEQWDGRVMIRPNVSYALWDADGMTGCACHVGYSGYNCSQIECPHGDVSTTEEQQNEIVLLECQADSGSFSITFRGDTTAQIPWDTPYAHLEFALESLSSIRDVSVTFTSNETQGVCGADRVAVTSIEFLQEFGDLPALRLGSEDLTLQGGPATLQALTKQTISCPPDCYGGCEGGFYLGYDGELTSKLPWNVTGTEVETALSGLSTLGAASDFGALNVTVNGSQICSSDGNWANTTVEFRGSYGNVYNLTMINSLRSRANTEIVNMTLTANKGTKENLICSDRGECDFLSGRCFCNMFSRGPFEYAFGSSDGYGGKGTRGDCGHAILTTPKSCPASFSESAGRFLECSGVGQCNNATYLCTCHAGFYSANCALRSCPVGVAWFSEATGPDEAREISECSGMGYCERSEGRCACRAGFGGPACERLDCPVDDTKGEYCSGHGTCLPMWRLAELADYGGAAAGLTYGSPTQLLEHVWDSRRVFGCHCDTKDAYQPNNGPVDFVSGVAVLNPMVGGYTGYDCSQRWCPVGDDPRTNPASFEVQTVYFTGSAGWYNLEFRRAKSKALHVNSNASFIEFVLENMTTIGDVDVSRLDSGVQVTFLSELGDLPTMAATNGFTVNETVKGTKENVECSNRGFCDYDTGECMCLQGHQGSGTRRDCSERDPVGKITLNKFTGPGKNYFS